MFFVVLVPNVPMISVQMRIDILRTRLTIRLYMLALQKQMIHLILTYHKVVEQLEQDTSMMRKNIENFLQTDNLR
jgi:hypothetical protein